MMNTGFLEASPGVKSAGRLIAVVVVFTAMAIAVGSFALLVIAFVSEKTEIVGSLVAVITASFGVAAIGDVMKNWAKKIGVSDVGKDQSGSA
jgi:hypothetical protein